MSLLRTARSITEVTKTWGRMVAMLEEDGAVDTVEMFHAKVDPESEVAIPREFSEEQSTARCLVTTIAFGMGMAIKDISYVIHWGPSSTILDYWQEVGRCARDGREGKAILYTPPHSTSSKFVTKEMQELVTSGACIRKAILGALAVCGIEQEDVEACCGGERCCSICSKN